MLFLARRLATVLSTLLALANIADIANAAEPAAPIKVGILGMDNYQCVAFAQLWHQKEVTGDLAGLKVVAAYPGTPSYHIEKSEKNTALWVERIAGQGAKIVDSPAALLSQVDAVILMSLDGSRHLEEIKPVLAAGKPVYVGRPLATTLEDAIRIFRLAKEMNCPIFSCSQHRFSPGFIGMREHPEAGKVIGCDVYGGYPPEQPSDDVVWGALHGVETLYTIMRPGCVSVMRTSTPDAELVVGAWEDGRIGAWRGIRKGAVKYSALVFGDKGIAPAGQYGYAAPIKGEVTKGRYMGYEGVAVEIARFFKTSEVPVSAEETLEIFAFLAAAEQSKAQGGVPVKLADVLDAANAKVDAGK